MEIIRRAAEEPVRWIAQNAGLEGSIVAAKVRDSKDKDFGFNAQTEAYENLIKAGVIDPVKVVRTALQNAVVHLGPAADDRGARLRIPGEGEGGGAGRPGNGRLLDRKIGRDPGRITPGPAPGASATLKS